MITGGTNSGSNTAELLHLNGSRLCSLPDLPNNRYVHQQSGNVICGGGATSSGEDPGHSCVTFTDGTWVESHKLAGRRASPSIWASPQAQIV